MRLVLLQRRSVVTRLDRVDDVCGFEEEDVTRCGCVGELSQGTDIIENPEPSSVCRNDEIVAVELEVPHRCDRHVQIERLPRVAVIERHAYRSLAACDEQTSTRRVLTHHVYVRTGRDPGGDTLPGSPLVARSIYVGLEVLKLMSVDTRVRSTRIEMRRLDGSDATPRRDGNRRHVLPGLSIVFRQMNQPVVGAHPQHPRAQR